MEAYILVKISRQTEHCGYARSIVEKMVMKGVEDAQLLFGDYDVVVKVKASRIHDIENLIFEEISMIEGVESTTTLLCVDEGILA